MSFDKHYPNRKDRRQQYRDSRRLDPSCRAGGDCPYCKSGRQHPVNIADTDFHEQLEDQASGEATAPDRD